MHSTHTLGAWSSSRHVHATLRTFYDADGGADLAMTSTFTSVCLRRSITIFLSKVFLSQTVISNKIRVYIHCTLIQKIDARPSRYYNSFVFEIRFSFVMGALALPLRNRSYVITTRHSASASSTNTRYRSFRRKGSSIATFSKPLPCFRYRTSGAFDASARPE